MGLLQATLSLDDFEFDTFELPESIQFGLQQIAGKHNLIGGAKVIDLLGGSDTDISWSGFFTGFQGKDRAELLKGWAKKGKKLKLKTSSFVKEVVIVRFTYQFKFIQPMPYTITLWVAEDKTQPTDIIVAGDVTDAILTSLAAAQDLADLVADGSVSSALAAAILAAQAVGSFTGGASEYIDKALAATQNGINVVNQAINATENGIFN